LSRRSYKYLRLIALGGLNKFTLLGGHRIIGPLKGQKLSGVRGVWFKDFDLLAFLATDN
jgi:hypothetical protein